MRLWNFRNLYLVVLLLLLEYSTEELLWKFRKIYTCDEVLFKLKLEPMADGLQFRVLENNLERLLYKIPPGDTFCPLLTNFQYSTMEISKPLPTEEFE